MAFPLTSLPNEVLTVVFSHLEVKERLKACLVCKTWLQLINCKSLLRDIQVCITPFLMENFSSPIRNFLNFRLTDLTFNDSCGELLQHLDQHAEFIDINDCKLNRNEIVSFAVTLKNLTVLKTNCDSWCVFPVFPNLSEFILSGNDTITDDGIATLQKTMKHLKILSLKCNIVFDHKIYRRFYPPGLTYEKNPSSAILSFPAIKSFISERVSTLHVLRFSKITDSALEELLLIKDLNLNDVYLNNMHDCSKGVIQLFQKQPNLKKLNLHFLRENLKCSIIDLLCASLPNIEQLTLKESEITNKSFKNLCCLNQLKALRIIKCKGITPSGFHDAICNFKPIKIKHLDLRNTGIFTKDLASFFKQLTHLVKLNLCGCHVIDDHLRIISTYLVNLKELDLSCNDITDDGLIGHFTIEGNQNTVSSDKKIICKAISNLHFLRVLSLEFCIKVTNDGIVAAIKFPYLRNLFLRGVGISDNAASVLFSRNPELISIEYQYLA